MNGRRVSFTVSGKAPVEMTLYFTFGYRGKNFAAFLDERGTFTFIDVKAIGEGSFAVVGDENVDIEQTSKVMKSILRAAKASPGEYPVNGCHYSVRDIDAGDGRRGFKAELRKALDSDFSKTSVGQDKDTAIGRVIKGLAKACICAVSILLFMLIYADSWVSFYLPEFFHDKALLAYFLVETVAVVLISLALKSFRRLGKFSILALLTLFFFSGLGAMITNGSVLRCTLTVTILAAAITYALGLYSVTEFKRAPFEKELTMPLKSVLSAVILSVIISSNAVALMLGVEAPLPKITDKEYTDIESTYNASLGTVHPDSWRITDEKSRVKVLQGITDKVCAAELGCFVPTLELLKDGEDNKGQIARYSDGDKKIYLDSAALRDKDVSELIKAVLTECRLSWQYYIDGMYDSIKDTIDKAYLALETFKYAVEIDRDFADGDVYGGFAEKDRRDWVSKRYSEDIERFVLYRDGKVSQGAANTPSSDIENDDGAGEAQNNSASQQPIPAVDER